MIKQNTSTHNNTPHSIILPTKIKALQSVELIQIVLLLTPTTPSSKYIYVHSILMITLHRKKKNVSGFGETILDEDHY